MMARVAPTMTAAPNTAAKATPGDGAAGAGLPLPQVASRQVTGPETVESTTVSASVAAPPALESRAWGTRPPTTAAATITTNPKRHVRGMGSGYEAWIKAR